MKKLFILLVLQFFSYNTSYSQATIVKIGESQPLKHIADAIEVLKTTTISGTYILEIQNDYDTWTERDPLIFPKIRYANENDKVIIRPAADRTLPIIWESVYQSVIVFDSTRNVIIDGSPGGNGTSRIITIRNLMTQDSYHYKYNCILFKNHTSGIIIKNIMMQTENYCIIFEKAPHAQYNSNIIQNCHLSKRRDVTRLNASYGILMECSEIIASTDNKILNNYFDYIDTCAINVSGKFNSTLIKNNHIYGRLDNVSKLSWGILLNSSGLNNEISENYIGGTEPFCAGDYYKIDNTEEFLPLVSIGSGTNNIIKKNLISNIDYSNGKVFYGIYNKNASIIDSNTVGGKYAILMRGDIEITGMLHLLKMENIISNNIVSNINRSATIMSTKPFAGIIINSDQNSHIFGNRIHNLTTLDPNPRYYLNCLNVITQHLSLIRIFNNLLNVDAGNTPVISLVIDGTLGNQFEVYYNTILTKSTRISNCINLANKIGASYIKNNIVANYCEGSLIVSPDSTNNIHSQNNFYLANDTAQFANWGYRYLPLTSWRKLTKDNSYYSNNSLLTSDLLFADAFGSGFKVNDVKEAWAFNNKGIPINYISRDIDTNIRSNHLLYGLTDIGANEFNLTIEPPYHSVADSVKGIVYLEENGRIYGELDYMNRDTAIGDFRFQIFTGKKAFAEADTYFYFKIEGERKPPYRLKLNNDDVLFAGIEPSKARLIMMIDTNKFSLPTLYDSSKGFFQTDYVTKWGIYTMVGENNPYDIKDEEKYVNTYRLYQNYPNPFNPSTTIKYNLFKSEHVKIKIFDVLGNQVDEVVNEYQSEGEHSVQFKNTGLVSGIYFYKIYAGEYTQSKKMILMK